MAIRGKPPEAGVRVGAWRFDNVPQDATRNGWIAGAVHALVMHTGRGSKPCFKALLGANAVCPGCEKQHRAQWFGYVPVKRDDGKPLVIGIHEEQFWMADAIPLGSRIVWGRNKGENEGVWIRQGPDKPTWRAYYPDERPHHNITDYLVLKLWKTPEVHLALRVLWAEECQRAVTDTVPPPIEPVESVPPAPELPASPDREKLVGEEYNRVVEAITRKTRRMREAEKNGKH